VFSGRILKDRLCLPIKVPGEGEAAPKSLTTRSPRPWELRDLTAEYRSGCIGRSNCPAQPPQVLFGVQET